METHILSTSSKRFVLLHPHDLRVFVCLCNLLVPLATLGTILPFFAQLSNSQSLHFDHFDHFWNRRMIILLKSKWGKRKGQSCKWLCVPIIEQMKMGPLPFNNIVSYDQRWLIDTLVVEIVIVCHRIGIAKGRTDPRALLHFWVFQLIIWQSIWSKLASWTYSGITLDIKVFSLWRTS